EGYNNWDTKTIETLPDHVGYQTGQNVSQNIVYTNAYGQVMLKVYETGPAGSTSKWITYYHYDAAGRVDKMAYPSAVNSYDELSSPGLIHTVGENYGYLNQTAGLVAVTTYNGSGYVQQSKVQRGWQYNVPPGPCAVLRDLTYISHQSSSQNGSITIQVVAS